MMRGFLLGFVLFGFVPGCAATPLSPPPHGPDTKNPETKAPATGVAKIKADAEALLPLVPSALGKRFLGAAKSLPSITPRTLYRDAKTKHVLREEEYEASAKTGTSVKIDVDEEFYYNTNYGSPLAYVRALSVLGEAGVTLPKGSRLFDFGYGGVGHLRMLASLGVHTVGVDVDPLLVALYGDSKDQGLFPSGDGDSGSVTLLSGSFPSDPPIRAAVVGPFDVIVSKNVLKKGYIHPDRPADEKKLIHLGVSDAEFLKAIAERLRPGGFFLIYNICPALSKPDQPFVPWSDGRSPFPPEAFEAAGLRVRIFDRDDTEAIRVIGKTLGWDQGEDAMDLKNDLSVLYTLVEKPAQ